MPRPKLVESEKKKKHPITMYCTASEAKKIKKLADKTNYSISEFCKKSVLNTESILNKEQVASYTKLVLLWSAISRNVNQMTKAINAIASRKDAKPSVRQLELIQQTQELIRSWNIKKQDILK